MEAGLGPLVVALLNLPSSSPWTGKQLSSLLPSLGDRKDGQPESFWAAYKFPSSVGCLVLLLKGSWVKKGQPGASFTPRV